MTRRGRKERGARSGPPGAGHRRPGGMRGRPGYRISMVTAVAIAAVAITAGAWLALRPRGAPRLPGTAASAHPAHALTPQAAYQTAVRLGQSGRHEESLPYYRRALTGSPPNPWLVHYNYAGCLYNIGLEVRERCGVAMPVTRSSIERVALMREALAAWDVAERLATTARDRATVLQTRAERLQIWGFPWEGFVLLRQAQWTDPERKELAAAADGYQLLLEHPERHGKRWAAADSTAR